MAKERAQIFSQAEQELLLEGYDEYKAMICLKGNTSKATNTRKEGWQKVADKLNASNNGTVRTWEQVKVKYKNILQTANKKKADRKHTGGGPALPDFTPAEELAMQQSAHHPVSEGIEGGSCCSEMVARCSSGHFIAITGNVIALPTVPKQLKADPCDVLDEDTVSVRLSGEEEPIASTHTPCGTQSTSKKRDGEKGASALHTKYLQQKIEYSKCKMQKMKQDLEVGELQKTKLQLQIQLLQKQMAEKQ